MTDIIGGSPRGRAHRALSRALVGAMLAPFIALAGAGVAFAGSGAQEDPFTPNDNMAVCHATGSKGNPYVLIHPSVTSGGPTGHDGHDDDIYPGYWFKQNANADTIFVPGSNTDKLDVWENGCKVPDVEEPPALDEVDVQVSVDACDTGDETTPVTVTFSGDGSATLTIYDASDVEVTSVTSSGSTSLPAGSYTYTVEAEEGSELSENTDASGGFTVEACQGEEPPADDEVDVQVAVDACETGDETTPVTVTFSGDGSATVTIRDASDDVVATVTSSGSTSLPAGSYTYTVVAEEGSELSENTDASGNFTVLECEGDDPPADDEVGVVFDLGQCETDGITSSTPVTFTFSGDGSATVTILDAADQVAATLSSSGSHSLTPGDYSYSIVADAGSVLADGVTARDTFTVVDCTPQIAPQGSVSVTLGACDYDTDAAASFSPVSVVIAPSGAATVTISDADGIVEEFSGIGGSAILGPGTYTWTAAASDGFDLTGETSGTLTAKDCPPVVLGGRTGGGSGGSGTLPSTGAGSPALLALGVMLLNSGLLMRVATKRRRGEEDLG